MTSVPRAPLILLLAVAVPPSALLAQRAPGHPIGKVQTIGNLIHIEMDEGAVAPERLFDLDHRTLRFTPQGSGYRVENVPLVWDSDFGEEMSEGSATLANFSFPFSGQSWSEFSVGNASISFGAAQGGGGGRGAGGARAFGRGGGFRMERYPLLQTVGRTFINTTTGIAVFVRPAALRGQRYLKELSDRIVVTWTLSESTGGIQAFSWTPTVNRMQAVLHSNGVIELSYNDVSARDAIVGIYPMVDAGTERALATLEDAEDAAVAPNLDVRNVRISSVDGLFLEATVETRGAVLPEGDPGLEGVTYRIALDAGQPASSDLENATVVWTIRGSAGGRGGGPGGAGPRYTVSGSGAQSTVTVDGNTISVRGILPMELAGETRVTVSADASAGMSGATDRVGPEEVTLTGIRTPEVDLSDMTGASGPLAVAYEGFHWSGIPSAQDVACTIITALGDNFDLIASYSDFRVDNPEGGTPSTGPRGGNISGIGSRTGNLGAYCSDGHLQWMFYEPVSTSAIQFDESSPDGRMTNYDYAMSQIVHELGHRWAADADALVNGELIQLGPTHWGAGVHLPAAFPYGRSYESDLMGGSTWKENGDGTYTQLDRDYYNPAKGFSWLGLYLMGLARPEEVEPFFILRNLQRTGEQDADGHPIYTGDKTVIHIEDVIAAMGPRDPDFDHAQKEFNTAIVIMTLPGKQPTQKLITGANNIARLYIDFWSKVTGGRSVMTTNPR